mgnify:CR=1 FL=1
MKEKYESLSLATLKDLAKARGLKGISTMRKPELIERMLEEDRKEEKHQPDPVPLYGVILSTAAIIMAEMKMQDVRTVIMGKTDRRTL